MTASETRLREAFSRFGVPVTWRPGYKTRGHGTLNAVGVVDHHTAGPASMGMVDYVENAAGRGCLANFSVMPTRVYVHSLRLTYHAGMNMQSRIDLAKAGRMPFTNGTAWAPSAGSVNGNRFFWGIECHQTGASPMTAQMRALLVRLNAALCWAEGWSAGHVIAHGELTSRKRGDPNIGGGGMGQVRRETRDLLNGKGAVKPTDPIIGDVSRGALLPAP